MRKKEKNEMMLKGKNRKDGLRPESPGRKRRLGQRPTLPLRHLSQRQQAQEVSESLVYICVNASHGVEW